MKSIAGAVGLAFSTQKLVEFSKESINLASDLQEVQNVVDTVFKNSKQEINDFAKTALEAYGLSELSAKKYASTMGAMLDSMQVDDGAMLKMSKNLTALSGDMASFYNLSGDDAFQKIRAGISGETEPLKQLGINMSVTNLEAYALSQGITKSYKAMTQSEQAILRYNYLLSVTANAQGDFVRTQDGWANQTRVLSERFNQLKIVVGDLLINVLTPAVKVLNELVSTALAFTQTLTAALGIEQNSAAASIDSATASQENLASATEDATEAQKAQNKAVASFDKLNDISESSDSAASSAAGSGGSSLDMALGSYATTQSEYDTSYISEKLEEILGIVGVAFLAIGAILTFTGANIPLGIGLMVVGAASLAAAATLDNSKISKDVSSTLDVIMMAVSGALMVIGVILLLCCVNPMFIGLGLALIAAGAIGLVAVAAFNWDSAKNNCTTAITAIMGVLGGAFLVIGALLAFTGVATGIGIALIAIGATAIVSAAALNWKSSEDKVTSVVTTIATVVGGALLAIGALLAFSGVAIPLGIGLIAAGAVAIAAAVVPQWSSLSDKTKKTVTTIAGILGAALLVIGAILVFTGVGIPLGLGMMLAGGAAVASAVSFNWSTITNKVKSTCNNLKKIFSVFGNDIKAWFTGLINKGIDTFEGFINKIIGGLNWLIAKLNAFRITIPSWVPEIGGKSLGFNISPFKPVTLPRLATGAVIPARSEFVAVLGDQKHGRNLEAPEGLIRQIVREESSRLTYEDIKSAFYAALLMAKQNGILDFDVNMDGRKVGQRIAKHVGKEFNRSGFVFRTAKG